MQQLKELLTNLLHRPIGWLVILPLVVGQLFFTFKGIECHPFLLYGMYSEPIPDKDHWEGFELQVNGEVVNLNEFSNLQAATIENTLEQWSEIEDHNAYEQWLRRYLSSILDQPIQDLQVLRQTKTQQDILLHVE